MKTRTLVGFLCLTTLGLHLCPVFGQGTVFTYQGRLSDTNGPVSGTNDFQFALYDAAAGPILVAGPLTNAAVAVSNGLFTTAVDFGAGVFTNAARWLEVAVRSFYANQNTRTPLVAAFLQAFFFVVLSLLLTPVIGLAGIPLSAALTFTTQAFVLLTLLNRRFPGLLRMGSTAWRALLSGAAAGGVALGLLVGHAAFANTVTLYATEGAPHIPDESSPRRKSGMIQAWASDSKSSSR